MTDQSTNGKYDLKSVDLPRMSGQILRLFVMIAESPLRSIIIPALFKNAGITWFREQQFTEPPTFLPIYHNGKKGASSEQAHLSPEQIKVLPSVQNHNEETEFKFPTVMDYAQAYREGKITPLEVAHKVVEAIETSNASDPPLRAIIAVRPELVLQQGEDATLRFQSGKPLSLLDGVPVAVKDELDMLPYSTRVGTAFLGGSQCASDSTVVSKMRDAGALLIGKANMHEIGIGVTGLNPIHGTPRNPYEIHHFTGGSSSGPAAAVSSGLCPVALGADGGGSIRIPASFCGVFGLKPTFGRISEFGAAPLTWSLAHLGPIAASTVDTAIAYAAMAGADDKDVNSTHQPALDLGEWENIDLTGLTLGVYWSWFRHASKDIVQACERMVEKLLSLGAGLKEIVIPDLEAGRIAHTIIIAGEMAQSLSSTYEKNHQKHGLDVRLNLALAQSFTTMDYVKSQRARTRLMNNFQEAFQQVDVILTPAAGITAPQIPLDALASGESDLSTLVEIMRFAIPANLTGLPAISFPVGYDQKNLPIGMQAIGKPWEESTLLRLALASEKFVPRRKPQVFFNLLPQ